MAFMELNPRYRDLLEQHGLVSPEDFLALPAVIICGHPDRNVARVTLGTGANQLPAFLKREHRIRWKDRLLNAWAGFGFVSKAYRESLTLRELEQAGIHCPECLAVGEDDQGRAFLLVREVAEAVDLRLFLRNRETLSERARRRFAQRLGAALAHVHNSGLSQPDLYSKHVLVNARDRAIYFLDWQRSRRSRCVGWRRRWRDLAALDATLGEELANIAERVICLRAYLRRCRIRKIPGKTSLLHSAFRISEYSRRLQKRRRIREMRRLPASTANQGLIWLDGESLCVTPEFQAELGGRIPDWLILDNLPARPGSLEMHHQVVLDEQRRACLVRRRQRRFWSGAWAWLRGRRRVVSPELEQAARIFRLERFGIQTPRLLAFGQRWVAPCWLESFLLTEAIPQASGVSKSLSGGKRPIAERSTLP